MLKNHFFIFGINMGKGTSIALIAIGLLMFLFFGLGGLGALFITTSYMRYMGEPEEHQ